MPEEILTYDDIIGRFTAWAREQTDIRCALIIGSRARTERPADPWADLDVVVFAEDPDRYIEAGDWTGQFGTVVLTFTERTGDGSAQERRVLYEGGLDVDFAFVPLSVIGLVMEGNPPAILVQIISRGVKILFDKDGFIEPYVASGIQRPYAVPPDAAEFLNSVNDFWFHAVWVAKHLRRGELWWAKEGCDVHLKNILRRMLEWHALARKGKKADTWFRGRFLEEWADTRAVKELKNAFARYDAGEVWKALINTMDLYRWVSRETARDFKFKYPEEADKYATVLVLQMELEQE